MSTQVIFDIPESWEWTIMDNISTVIGGGTPKTKVPEYFEGGSIPWLTPADLSGYTNKYISHGERFITEEGLNNSSARMMPTGTVLFTSRAPIGYVAIAKNPICTNQGFKSFVLKEKIFPDYVYWWLKGNKDLAQSYASGTTFLELSGAKAKQLPIPLAPLNEQKRIVAEIEKQFSRLDEAVAALKRIKANLKRYKASVLKAAVEGKLTEEWREEHPDVEHGAILLDRIIKRRKEKSKGKNKNLTPLNKSELSRIPETWEWTRVGDVYDIVGGGTPPTKVSEYWKGNIPWITSADIHGIKDIRPRKQISKKGVENSATNIVPKNNIIVVTRVGLGKVALTNTPICFSQDSQALISNNSLLFPDYSAYYLSKAVQVFKFEHRGTTIAGVTKKQLAELPFALPPLQEQRVIVEEIERRLSVAEGIGSEIDATLKRAERLRHSILKNAFSGHLTSGGRIVREPSRMIEGAVT